MPHTSGGGPTERGAAALFDQWADAGRDASMADGHRDVTGQVLDGWTLTADHHVLDVGCGNGWAVGWMRQRGAGRGSGVDIAPRMIAHAKAALPDNHFAVAGAQNLPFADGSFSHLLSVESLYYYPDPQAALSEWRRVTASGGQLAVVVDLYQENPATHAWIDALEVPVHLLGEADYINLARAAGWQNPRCFRVIDRRPLTLESNFKISPYWPSYDMYVSYRREGSLALEAEAEAEAG